MLLVEQASYCKYDTKSNDPHFSRIFVFHEPRTCLRSLDYHGYRCQDDTQSIMLFNNDWVSLLMHLLRARLGLEFSTLSGLHEMSRV